MWDEGRWTGVDHCFWQERGKGEGDGVALNMVVMEGVRDGSFEAYIDIMRLPRRGRGGRVEY